MPLTMLSVGKEAKIDYCRANDKTKKYLEDLGLIPGAIVSIVSELGGNLILSVKDSRIALSKGVASQLIVES